MPRATAPNGKPYLREGAEWGLPLSENLWPLRTCCSGSN